MSAVLADRRPAAVPAVHPLIAERWSPRAFDPAPLGLDDVTALLEAARWAPSARNDQPWRFLVGASDATPATHDGILATLAPPNRAWAQHAPLLVAALVRVEEEDGAERAVGPYELGLAVAQLTAQAGALGLHVHQIGGFDAAALSSAFEVPEQYRVVVVLAVGRLGDPGSLPAWAQAREGAARSRLPLDEIAFAGAFGRPLDLGSPAVATDADAA